jgi:hypothetical protein
MATPYRRDARGAVSDARRTPAIQKGVPARRVTRFGGTAFRWFTGSLGLAFWAGVSIGLYQTLHGSMGDSTDIADFAFHSTSRMFNAPVEWTIDTFALANPGAEILLNGMYYVSIPYQALAYAGGYSGSTIAQIMQNLIPSWSFHF